MGGLCSKVSVVDKLPSDSTLGRNQAANDEIGSLEGENPPVPLEDAETKRMEEQHESFSPLKGVVPRITFQDGASDGGRIDFRASQRLALSPSQKSDLGKARGGTAKVSEVSSILSRASTVGLEKAVQVLDTLGSSVTNLNASTGFASSSAAKGKKICMLALELANTIIRGYNLMRSVSKTSIDHLKEVVLHSEGVQHLVSKDMDELLKIAAADKREELKAFTKEVIRFGNCCKDPRWHNLDHYFEKLASEPVPQYHLKGDAPSAMQRLIVSAKYTLELYKELRGPARFQSNYRGSTSKGDSLHLLTEEGKGESKHVKILKERSLWYKNLEEIMEKFIDIIHFLHMEIYDAFGCADTEEPQELVKHDNRLGPAGLALHYANTINLIDTFVYQPSEVTQNTRETLYHGLPPTIKSTLHSKLRSFKLQEEITATQIKTEMEKVMRWLVPFAKNTLNAQHGSGWAGEEGNKGPEVDSKLSGQIDFSRIETLYHADKETTEAHMLQLVLLLHHLILKSRNANQLGRSRIKSPISSSTKRGAKITVLPKSGAKTTVLPGETSSVLSHNEKDMLRNVKYWRFINRMSKSQDFDTHSKQSGLSRSKSHPPTTGDIKDLLSARSSIPKCGEK